MGAQHSLTDRTFSQDETLQDTLKLYEGMEVGPTFHAPLISRRSSWQPLSNVWMQMLTAWWRSWNSSLSSGTT